MFDWATVKMSPGITRPSWGVLLIFSCFWELMLFLSHEFYTEMTSAAAITVSVLL
jgi:hypothetical protein